MLIKGELQSSCWKTQKIAKSIILIDLLIIDSASFFNNMLEDSVGKGQSSSQVVVLNDDDLLTLILLHVPWKKLMSLKCVSKQWLSLIANPHQIRLRSLHPLPTSAFFFHIPCKLKQLLYFVHLEHPDTPSPFSTMKSTDTFNPRQVVFVEIMSWHLSVLQLQSHRCLRRTKKEILCL